MVLTRTGQLAKFFSVVVAAGTLTGTAHADLTRPSANPRELIGPVMEAARSFSTAVKATQTGIASWYGGQWIGRKTANGERYQQDDSTAAHRTLPFGTFVRVTNLRNKKSTVVRINNRGPFVKGRIIDLSKRPATELGLTKSGIAKVRIDVLSQEIAVASL